MGSAELDWSVIQRYFRDTPFFLTRHQFDSYHDFVLNKIPYIIKTLNSELLIIKYAEDKKTLKHEIRPFIGGRDGTRIYYSKPTIVEGDKTRPLFPNEARLKDLSYMMDLFVDVEIEYKDFSGAAPRVETRTFSNVLIGQIPIMVRSHMCSLDAQPDAVLPELGECPYDQGGYFIMNGKEKVMIAQERISTNRIFFERVRDDPVSEFAWHGFMRCTSRENNLFPKTINFGILNKDYMKGSRRGAITVTCPKLERGAGTPIKIPVFVMFRALGVESDREILRHIVPGLDNAPLLSLLRASVIDNEHNIFSQEEALQYLKSFVRFNDRSMVLFVLTEEFLPNVGKNFADKALMLGHIVNRIARISMGAIPEADRDNFMYKRVDTSGSLMANLFRDFYNEFRNNVRNTMDRFYNQGNWGRSGMVTDMVNADNFRQVFRDDSIRVGFTKSLRGRWGVSTDPNRQVADPAKQGIVQDLGRLSYIGYISHVRRLSTPIDDTLKITGPRRLRAPAWGYICPVESPDGSGIGIIKHFAMLNHTTLGSDPKEIEVFLWAHGTVPLAQLTKEQRTTWGKVLIDDVWIGMHSETRVLADELRAARRAGRIDRYVGISWNILRDEVHARTEAGRFSRPIYVVKDGARVIDGLAQKNGSWESLLVANALEYIDAEEADVSLIAMRAEDLADRLKHYTHCEIHPSTILSAYSSSVPFPNHIPAPRCVFSAAQIKQAIGVYATNFNHRMDRASYVLHYPQAALINTRYTTPFYSDSLPYGENLIVAVATYTGYNQEDALIINASSVERGMFNTSVFKSVVAKEDLNRSTGQRIQFADPAVLGVDVKGFSAGEGRPVRYDKSGFPAENTYIHDGEAFVGMVSSMPPAEGGEERAYEYKPIVADKTFYGMVDKVFVYPGETPDLKRAKIRFRKVRTPELGDKMASRYAIKGVCGMLIRQEDMPFTADGLVPDLIVNPHSFPTRLSMAQVMELLMSKACCAMGGRIDGTAFEAVDLSAIADEMERAGLNHHGDEIMYNGRTGDQMPTQIYIGPTYYCRLKHMVADKINYRSGDGPRSMATHQPVKGRARGGGLRVGEMENNVLLAHGFGSFSKECMMKKSDGWVMDVDTDSGNMAITNPREGFAYSSPGVSSTGITRIETPFTLKMMLQELEGMGIAAQLHTKNENENENGYDDDGDSVGEYMADSDD
jgi:DNA-directed RNA polymerase II subunit RPB2